MDDKPADDKTVAAKPDLKVVKPKPTAAQVHDAMHRSLKEMVRQCEAAGQRDQPHVMAAREALAMAEPDEGADK